MQVCPKRKKKKSGAVGITILSVLYVILVVLIPILGFGNKGSGTNTILKALIFITYLIVMLFQSHFRMQLNRTNIYILFSFLITQGFCIVFTDYSVNIINVVIQAAIFFALLFLLPVVQGQKKEIITGIKLFVLFDFVAAIYNFILHFERYANLSFLNTVYYDMHSFFDNKNTYGGILFVALVLLFYWYYLCDKEDKRTRKWVIVLICVQIFAIATSMCRTALVCTFVFLFCNFFKKFTTKRFFAAPALLALIGLAFAIPSVREYLLYILLRVDVDTFREPIVEASWQIVENNMLFGTGLGSWEGTLEAISGNPYSHNGFLTILMTGGAIYFLAYITLFIYGLRWALRITKVDFGFGSQVVICLITVVIYAFFESIVLCEANSSNFAFTTAALIIPRLYWNQYVRSGSKEQHIQER